MKQILFILLLISTKSILADCMGYRIWVFPNGNKITQNSIFILNGYARSQDVILGLNKKYNVYLKSGNKKVKLIVQEILEGQYSYTQALLKPESILEVGLEYTIFIDDIDETLSRYNRITKKHEPLSFIVDEIEDKEKPEVISKPELLRKTIQHGCGPSTHVIFSSPVEDNSEIFIKTTVKSLKTNKKSTFYLDVDEKEIFVGYGMCGGAFLFNNGENYEVKFDYMDASGNITNWEGEGIKFTKPSEKSKFSE